MHVILSIYRTPSAYLTRLSLNRRWTTRESVYLVLVWPLAPVTLTLTRWPSLMYKLDLDMTKVYMYLQFCILKVSRSRPWKVRAQTGQTNKHTEPTEHITTPHLRWFFYIIDQRSTLYYNYGNTACYNPINGMYTTSSGAVSAVVFPFTFSACCMWNTVELYDSTQCRSEVTEVSCPVSSDHFSDWHKMHRYLHGCISCAIRRWPVASRHTPRRRSIVLVRRRYIIRPNL